MELDGPSSGRDSGTTLPALLVDLVHQAGRAGDAPDSFTMTNDQLTELRLVGGGDIAELEDDCLILHISPGVVVYLVSWDERQRLYLAEKAAVMREA